MTKETDFDIVRRNLDTDDNEGHDALDRISQEQRKLREAAEEVAKLGADGFQSRAFLAAWSRLCALLAKP